MNSSKLKSVNDVCHLRHHSCASERLSDVFPCEISGSESCAQCKPEITVSSAIWGFQRILPERFVMISYTHKSLDCGPVSLLQQGCGGADSTSTVETRAGNHHNMFSKNIPQICCWNRKACFAYTTFISPS